MTDDLSNSGTDEHNMFSPPSISPPKGGGSIRGMGEKFAVNPVTGTGKMTIPLALSQGRSDFSPDLVLYHDSGSGNGPFGYGWTLQLPAITRKTDKGLPQYIDSDEFLLSDAEDLVPVLTSEGHRFVDDTTDEAYIIHHYRPRIEGLFARIERWTHRETRDIHWRSITRHNVTTIYGRTVNSRICDPEDQSKVFSWLISESYDDKGHAILYEYEAEDEHRVDMSQINEKHRVRDANRYIKRIRYGNKISRFTQRDLQQMTWLFEAVFDYDEGHYERLKKHSSQPEDDQHQYVKVCYEPQSAWAVRPDPFSNYRAGFEVRSYRRCHRLLMYHHFRELGSEPTLVKATTFHYDDWDDTQSSDIESELAYQGSTRIASFLCGMTQAGYVRAADDGDHNVYIEKIMPPLEFTYSKVVINTDLQQLNEHGAKLVPMDIDGVYNRFVDLNGEGLSGILSHHMGSFTYKPNLGGGSFGPAQTLSSVPSVATSDPMQQQWLDLAGDGQLELVTWEGPLAGFYERTDEGKWKPFQAFKQLPHIDWNDPNLCMIDLNGDGHADILLTEQEVLTIYPSLQEDGFGEAYHIYQSNDEEQGARIVLDDGTQSIYLADMSGDGLTDLVRIRNGEICYWPNLGYGRFGAKVTMDNAPWFDHPDQFQQRRLLLADIDGSGVTDIVYMGTDGARLFYNYSGNSWSNPVHVPLPLMDDEAKVMAADLLGNGTTCLIWSTALPYETQRSFGYIDLMGGQKPYLMIKSVNNLGLETTIQYTSSTTFYLQDKFAGKPWITKMPFPVHVVERLETIDHINGSRSVTRHAYHHGYYDGNDREFRGFGLVETWDTEEFAIFNRDQKLKDMRYAELASHVPPTYMRTWYHTGVYEGKEHTSDLFAAEYFEYPHVSDDGAGGRLLQNTTLPPGLTSEEEREACRALKGLMLRKEVYALDGTEQAPIPYMVNENNYALMPLQLKHDQRSAVFLAYPYESIQGDYERNPVDPRMTHTLTLDVDAFGNVLKSATIAYGRTKDDETLSVADQLRQREMLMTYTEHRYTNKIDENHDYRTPLHYETLTYELTGMSPPVKRLNPQDVLAAWSIAELLSYEQEPTYDRVQKRLIAHTRTLFRGDDLAGALPLGVIESRALIYEKLTKAFTVGFLAQTFGDKVTDELLENEGRYVQIEGDEHWWIPSGRVLYSLREADTPQEELAYALEHFFQPCRYRDPFHTEETSTETIIRYDDYDLLVVESCDALGNRVTAGERDIDPAKPVVRQGLDYRVMQPVLIMDANRNCTAVAYDALGLVVGTAIMGKPEDRPAQGDSFDTWVVDLTDTEVKQSFAVPLTSANQLLKGATTRMVYDLFAYYRSRGDMTVQPVMLQTIQRITHVSGLAENEESEMQVSVVYLNGYGKEIQRKVQAEAGPVPLRDEHTGQIIVIDSLPVLSSEAAKIRWIGSGWTVLNNKGMPVLEYEPFFTDTHRFEEDTRIGFSKVTFYDPLLRVVGLLHPDHTWEKQIFTPWKNEAWDISDTVLQANPVDDEHLGDFFQRLPASSYLPTWHAKRASGALGELEQRAAHKASAHANTPTIVHYDALGRPFLSVAHNAHHNSGTSALEPPSEAFYETRTTYDIQGNVLEVEDALGRVIVRHLYAMEAAEPSYEATMDAGERWIFHGVVGEPLRIWNSRNHQLRTAYDPLRRPEREYVKIGDEREMMTAHTVYGESVPSPEQRNSRGQVVEQYDQAGKIVHLAYDFKGNLLSTQRQLAKEYKQTRDWSRTVPLEAAVYTSHSRFDALNRPIELTAPDQSVIIPTLNAAGWIERVDAQLSGESSLRPFVTHIAYDAKGRRTSMAYGNGVQTHYTYDPVSSRLIHMLTRRDTTRFPDDCVKPPSPTGWPGCHIQNLSYTYDAAGNVTHIQDDAQQMIFNRNQRVEPSTSYTYDALGRLTEATGREHIGQAFSGLPDRLGDPVPMPLNHPSDGQAMGTYVERYLYDAVGNLLSMQHRSSDPHRPGWTRSYHYSENSLLDSALSSNRLSYTMIDDVNYPVKYEGQAGRHGLMTSLSHLPIMQWDYKDQLQATSPQVVHNNNFTPEMTWYVYNEAGQRVRKITERAGTAGKPSVRKSERIYLDIFEIYREYDVNDEVSLERTTLHVMDGKERIALVEQRTKGEDLSSALLLRYQYGNHLGSTGLELDDEAQIISYEEYTPYGSTSYWATRSQTETPKRYRFTAKERDEESGLQYHGARYYAPWLGRWISPDPEGLIDGVNRYAYARCNPLFYIDLTGTQSRPSELGPNHPNHPHNDDSADDSEAKETSEGLQTRWEEAQSDHDDGSGGMTSNGINNGSDLPDQANPTSTLSPTFTLTTRSFAPFETFGGGFEGDNRGFTENMNVTSRISQSTTFTLGGSVVSNVAHSSPSRRGRRVATSDPTSRGLATKNDDQSIRVAQEYAGNNPLVPLSPDIDVSHRATISIEAAQDGTFTLRIQGQLQGDTFPSAEVIFSDASGRSVLIHTYATSGGRNTGPFRRLPLKGDKPMGDYDVFIKFDAAGNITSVSGPSRQFKPASEWNRDMRSRPAQAA